MKGDDIILDKKACQTNKKEWEGDTFNLRLHPLELPIIFTKSPAMREALHLTLYNFNIDEQMIIRMYYHIEMTVSEITEVSGVSPDYIVGTLIVYSERLRYNIYTFCKESGYDEANPVDIKELFEFEFIEAQNCNARFVTK